MALKSSTKTKLRTVFSVTLTGVIIGPLFVSLAFGFDFERVLKGLIAGFTITFLSSIFETFIFQSKLKRLSFTLLFIIKTLFYVILISFTVITVWVVHESLLNNNSIFVTMATDDFKKFMTTGDFPKILIFAATVSLLINFFVLLNSLVGKGVLLKYVTGKYHSPVIEERIFMFLDLESSTSIAEKIGAVGYHKFMNNYFFDINDPIIESKGEIYQYVGDEIVVSWTLKNGVKNNNCIKCFFDISEKISSLAEKYQGAFGYVPGFKAGLHFGEAVIGEIGDDKKDIVFHGDVMNTTSRIQAQSKIMNKKLVISEDLLKLLSLDGKYKSEDAGTFMLKGKENEIQLFSIVKAGS